MKRPGWIPSLLLLGLTAVTVALAGDAYAGDKGGKKEKKDKKDKKNKKVEEITKEGQGKSSFIDPTKPKKAPRGKGAARKEREV